MKFKTVKPSSSYQLSLPEDTCEQFDERVSSFWLEGKPLLLQFSSYLREKEPQVRAQKRLEERIAKHAQQWNIWKDNIYPDSAVDQATAEFTDENHVRWVHAYLVWPHLTIYVTISGPEETIRDRDNWAFQSLKTLTLVIH
jgi:hypothetical protein